MALNDHVTQEQYDQTLRDTVNAYYEHAMNDPSMSHEEAVSSTAQMAEEYPNAVDEFQASAEAQEAALTDEVSGESVESAGEGLDGGDDGGIDSDDGIE